MSEEEKLTLINDFNKVFCEQLNIHSKEKVI
jgi:hypothetical protein